MKKVIKLFFILFIVYISAVPVFGENSGELSIAAGVVPHHLLAKDIMEDFFAFIAGQKHHPDTIILLSPDHFNSALLDREISFITVDWESNPVKLGDIPIDSALLKELSIENELRQNQGAVLSEFGITHLLPLIREYLPAVKIVPLLIPTDIPREQVAKLVKNIHEISSSGTIMIASVDFSHYLPPEAAIFHDIRSIRVLLNCEEEYFENIEVDSWQSLYAVRLFAKLQEKEYPVVIAHKNSVDFLPFDFDKTTSYFSVIFQEEEITQDTNDLETILLTGDVMLDRGIEKCINQKSVYYPFQNIVQLLRGVDIVFANLEGPIVENPPEFAHQTLQFAFHPKVLEGITWSQINLFSLANNHTTDMGKDGLEETMDWLEKYQDNFVGNPLSDYTDKQNPSFSTEHSIFLAFNRVLPFVHHREEIIAEIKAVKLSNPEKLIIVSMHWGTEYQSTSSLAQRELARQIIAAGADLIVGHHPHVVQEIEIVEDELIFYSLGNFIFDRQFASETREGLSVGLTVYPDRITCRLFPIQINSGQPMLMNQNRANEFLKNLAQKSDNRLWNDIERGIIEVQNK